MIRGILFNWLMDYLKPDKLISLALWLAGNALKEVGGLDYTVQLPKDLTDLFVKKIKDGQVTDEETGEFLIELSRRI